MSVLRQTTLDELLKTSTSSDKKAASPNDNAIATSKPFCSDAECPMDISEADKSVFEDPRFECFDDDVIPPSQSPKVYGFSLFTTSSNATTDSRNSMKVACNSSSGSVSNSSQKPTSKISLKVDEASTSSAKGEEASAVEFRGCRLSDLPTKPSISFPLPPLKCCHFHSVHFKISDDLQHRNVPTEPYPSHYSDAWDNFHVKLPCSTSEENLYPIIKDERQELVNRWELIKSALSDRPILSSVDLEEAILAYNTRYASRWSFRGLHKLCNEVFDDSERQSFFYRTLPNMIELALKLPVICTKPIPLLLRQRSKLISLSQEQIACLLCHAFFCTYPRRNASAGKSKFGATKEYANFPDINFNRLFASTQNYMLEKLKCIIHYFERVTSHMPCGTMSFERRVIPLDEMDSVNSKWQTSDAKLRRLFVSSEGTIETEGAGMLQLDFANKFIGGGVLGSGCVQEEIRFIICPELLVSLLFTEAMHHNECLILTGCEQFSTYCGYNVSFKRTGSHIDTRPRDSWGRRCTEVLAIDAYPFHAHRAQFDSRLIDRELLKAYCGFSYEEMDGWPSSAVATGNWGCGAFGGDKELKSVIQLLAAAEAKRDVAYFTFGDRDLETSLTRLHNLFVQKQASVHEIYAMLIAYCERVVVTSSGNKALSPTLFEFLESELSSTN